MRADARQPGLASLLETALPKVVVAPSFAAMLVFIYGFILWTLYISMTKSTFLPTYDFVGLAQYIKLWRIERWWVACRNLLVYGGLFIFFCTVLGLMLAIFLDQKIRIEGALRTIYLYPLALSFVVTGTAWKWLLNPGLGIERLMREMGWSSFTFDWLVTSEMSIYCVVIAAVWQSTGFVMAMFLAGLRGIDDSIIKAAQVDGLDDGVVDAAQSGQKHGHDKAGGLPYRRNDHTVDGHLGGHQPVEGKGRPAHLAHQPLNAQPRVQEPFPGGARHLEG